MQISPSFPRATVCLDADKNSTLDDKASVKKAWIALSLWPHETLFSDTLKAANKALF